MQDTGKHHFSSKERVSGSFRDPSGYVFQGVDGEFYRTINTSYLPHWELITKSGFSEEAIRRGLLLPFSETDSMFDTLGIHAQKIPFISYPYEWSFEQLKQAALVTLRLQLLALDYGLILKDASAYNIQYIGGTPIFIDHLSFEKYSEGNPWVGYQQFCKHFLAPLLIAKYRGFFALKMLSQWIDGIPLDIASTLLPTTTKFLPSIFIHIHAHAYAQSKYSDARQSSRKMKSINVSKRDVVNISKSLLNMIEGIFIQINKTEWGDYYQDTNYTSEGTKSKHTIVREISTQGKKNGIAIDLGANTGVFSKILSEHYHYVISSDIDPLAVNRHFQQLSAKQTTNILPMVIDLATPSPGIGWACRERLSFQDRVKASCITALALIHHLVITAGIPISLIAEYFSSLLSQDGILILEFVPKHDSQVQRLLAARADIFPDYTKEHCIAAFKRYFFHHHEYSVRDSDRTIHFFKKI